ncbi:MAG TPA: GNAT family N-acetyltransferase [Ktedonosporobacter sp.]|jgi:ribosomal protein S18 acetylase RimI-like enzyme|nr:GNAT family N-acetyltransferase [Ktedonosporobacter sp.]
MARSLAEAVPAPQFPAGFTLRPVAGENEVEAVVALHQDAFGTRNMTRDGRLSILRNPEYVPELDLLLVAPDGTLAAFCYCTIPKEANAQSGRNEGEIAIIGTGKAYQNRGLGRAMVLAGLQSLKQFGIETATLGTSSENVKAQAVFAAAGFHIVYKTLWYSKSV